jgi:hypothetical protein
MRRGPRSTATVGIMKASAATWRAAKRRRAIRGWLVSAGVVLLLWAAAAVTIHFAVARDDDRSLLLFLSVVIALVTLMALLPIDRAPDVIWWVARSRQRARMRSLQQGRCLRCGYDLRSSPELCPECGHRRPSPEYAERLHRSLGPRLED